MQTSKKLPWVCFCGVWEVAELQYVITVTVLIYLHQHPINWKSLCLSFGTSHQTSRAVSQSTWRHSSLYQNCQTTWRACNHPRAANTLTCTLVDETWVYPTLQANTHQLKATGWTSLQSRQQSQRLPRTPEDQQPIHRSTVRAVLFPCVPARTQVTQRSLFQHRSDTWIPQELPEVVKLLGRLSLE